MYVGVVTIHQKQYTDRYKPGFGTYTVCLGLVPVERHHYRCDTCQRDYLVSGPAEEPFYCASEPCRKQHGMVRIEAVGAGKGEWR